MANLQFRDDYDAQDMLGRIGVNYKIAEVLLGEFDWVGSRENNARMGSPLNEVSIETYERAMREGDIFPRIVVQKTPMGYFILGGNQRAEAMRRIDEFQKVSAYVITGDVSTSDKEAIIRSLNARHGWATDRTERLEHAEYLCRVRGFSVADAARLMNVGSHSVGSRVKAAATRKELAQAGIDTSELPIGALASLERVKNNSLRDSLARVAVEHRPSVAELDPVTVAVSEAGSVAEGSKAIKSFAKDLKRTEASRGGGTNGKTPKGRVRKPRRQKFYRLLRDLNNFLERGNGGSGFSSLDELQCNETDDKEKIDALVSKITIRLSVIGGKK